MIFQCTIVRDCLIPLLGFRGDCCGIYNAGPKNKRKPSPSPPQSSLAMIPLYLVLSCLGFAAAVPTSASAREVLHLPLVAKRGPFSAEDFIIAAGGLRDKYGHRQSSPSKRQNPTVCPCSAPYIPAQLNHNLQNEIIAGVEIWIGTPCVQHPSPTHVFSIPNSNFQTDPKRSLSSLTQALWSCGSTMQISTRALHLPTNPPGGRRRSPIAPIPSPVLSALTSWDSILSRLSPRLSCWPTR